MPFTLSDLMPVPDETLRVPVNGITLHCERYGSGPPLLLISGLGSDTGSWAFQLEDFRRHFGVIAFDNRGAGRSDKPTEPFSIATMAQDVAGLLDALGIEAAHVMGVSMGGLIAQEFALTYPQMLRRLVLVCTGFGGTDGVPPTPEVFQALLLRDPDPAVNVRRAFRLFSNDAWVDAHPDLVEAYVAHRIAHQQPAYAYAHQAAAIAAFDAGERVHQIAAPTLVLHGTGDRVVVPQNGHLLAERIPNAVLMLFPGGGHIFFMEDPPPFNKAVLDFLR